MKNIFIISTNKPSKLHEYDYLSPMGLSKKPLQWRLGRNIYITSDEVPKLDEYGINTKNNVVFKSKGFTPDAYDKEFCKKIILTTDQDLIKDGVQAIDDEFLEWVVKNPSCESVKVTFACLEERQCMCKSNDYCLKSGYEIIIPKEESKQETLEQALDNYINILFTRAGFINGVNWQKERSFTLEQIDELFFNEKGGYFDEFLDYRLGLISGLGKNKITFEQWFNQNKK